MDDSPSSTPARRTALITGSARGVGRGIALSLGHAGYDIVVVDLVERDEIRREAEETARQLTELGSAVLVVPADVTSETDMEAAVAATIERFGGLDLVVANAGIIADGEMRDMSVEAWREVIDVNLTGSWLTCRSAVNVLTRRPGSSLIVISSGAAYRGAAGYSAYCASKAGLIGMVRALSHELAPHDVRINLIAPGYLGTSMWFEDILKGEDPVESFGRVVEDAVPLRRPQTPADIGQAVVYLADARNVTGSELIIDGGRTAGP